MKKNIEKTLNIFDKIITFIKIICVISLIAIIGLLAIQRFSNNEKAIFGFRVFNVATESMVPKYLVGDILIVKEIPLSTLKIGDDVTYLGKVGTFKDKVVTHQLKSVEIVDNQIIYHTQGIANNAEDPTITGDQIYGKVIYKCIILSAVSKLINNMTAVYVVFFIPLAILVFLQIKDRKNEDEEDEEDDEDESNVEKNVENKE